jgi:hypothetical protein
MQKIPFKSALIAIVALGLVAPLAHAQTPNASGKNFCAQVEKLRMDVDKKVTERMGTVTTRRAERTVSLETRRDDRDMRLRDHRDTRRDNLAEHFTKLEARATTDAERAAVAAFRTAMEAARGERRAAIDAAIAAFRTGTDNVLAERRTAVDTAAKRFEDTTRAAMERARTSCASATADGSAVRTALRADLKNVKDRLRTDRDGLDKKDALKPLIAARKTAIDKAITDFKAAMEKAKTDLKAAFPNA